ncbi:MAG: sugar phosphate isomerase/epimerase [Lachnospiraceae bacterium]|nr:sugar phosphate isomerase/epimerase [Lachnospiraceae bacterium]
MNVSFKSIINPQKPMKGIEELQRSGFDSIMLPIDYFDGVIGSYTGIIEKCKENRIHIPIVYAPRIPTEMDTENDMVQFPKESIDESIKICKEAGSRYLIVDSCWNEPEEFLLRIGEEAAACGVSLLMRNQYRRSRSRIVRGDYAEITKALELVDGLNQKMGEEVFGFCVDTGVCALCRNDVYTFITALGRRIKAVILRDCDGYHDGHMMLFSGISPAIDWKGVVRGLRETGFDGEMVIDFFSTIDAFPSFLRPQLYALMKSVADYFCWQVGIELCLKRYPSRVLFGAGNMCRKYMETYGKKYPPLFTCDNNPKLWATEIYGLEVRTPEALKDLREDCGIFICNIHYQEIEAQLREMGIHKNIEYFNDEYMPPVCFDWLDMRKETAY